MVTKQQLGIFSEKAGTETEEVESSLLRWPEWSVTGIILLFCFVLIFFSSIRVSALQLTQEEKLEDFEFLYTTLRDNYVYFDVILRRNNINWLENYEKYRVAIKETSDDIEFYQAINSVILELRQGHTYLLPFSYYDYFSELYSQVAQDDSTYLAWVEELTNDNVGENKEYWETLLYQGNEIGSSVKEGTDDNNEVQATRSEEKSNIYFMESENGRTAVLGFRSFDYYFMETDKDSLMTIYSSLNDYENLIIDLQGNTGGTTSYWKKLIVSHIATDEYTTQAYLAFRNTPFVKRYYAEHFITATDKIPDLPNIPPELQEWEVLIDEKEITIKPDSLSIDYQGDIYLLVDGYVYSASEAFTVFAKYSDFAQVAGVVTGGDGIGRDPVLFSLPNSGICVLFPVFMGLNPDGSSSEEKGTTPDIILEGDTAKDRREELIRIIEQQ